jgi:hypothetical protein
MRYGLLVSAAVVAGVIQAASLGSGSAAAQGQSSSGTTTKWTAGRTAWGDPDLQGKWAMADTGTPMERPKEFANRELLTDAELAAKVERVRRQAPESEEERTANANKRAPEHEKGIRYQEYNAFWNDAGPRQVTPWRRSSLVIDPPDGRIPPLTLDAVRRLEAREAARRTRGEADSWVDRNLSERCLLTAFVRFSGNGTGTIKQFIQTPGYVTIIVYALNANNPIVVPLDGRSRPAENVRTWMGIPRGRWEGTTLVVETTHINNQQDGGPVMPSRTPYAMPSGSHLGPGDTVRLTERFTRVSADQIEYSYTIDDPRTYVRPYTVLRPLTRQPDDLLMPENGCHEGNYGIVGQLSAGRADEEYASKAAEAEAAERRPQLDEMKRRSEEWAKSHPSTR